MAAQMDRVPLGSASIKLTTIHLSSKIGGRAVSRSRPTVYC